MKWRREPESEEESKKLISVYADDGLKCLVSPVGSCRKLLTPTGHVFTWMIGFFLAKKPFRSVIMCH